MKEKEEVKIAGAQMEPKIGEKEKNLARCLELMQLTAREGAKLVVFPECTLTGYLFKNSKEALQVAETVLGPSVNKLIAECHRLNLHVVVGLLEKDVNKCYNTAVLLGPNGLVGKHRKLHRPGLGVDWYLEDGDGPLKVYDINVEIGVIRIGIGICYDMMFPELSRVLALEGADILVFPANWPETGNVYPDYIVPTRAIENHVYCITVNRIGKERGTNFGGRSKIVDYYGCSMVEGKNNEEDIIYADINLTEVRNKNWEIDKGKHEVNVIKDRRSEMYSRVCKVE
jgi:predicted amidohydrolase